MISRMARVKFILFFELSGDLELEGSSIENGGFSIATIDCRRVSRCVNYCHLAQIKGVGQVIEHGVNGAGTWSIAQTPIFRIFCDTLYNPTIESGRMIGQKLIEVDRDTAPNVFASSLRTGIRTNQHQRSLNQTRISLKIFGRGCNLGRMI